MNTNTSYIARTKSGNMLHIAHEGSTHLHCGSSWGYFPSPARWTGKVKFCGRCCSPDGIRIIRAIVSFLTMTEV